MPEYIKKLQEFEKKNPLPIQNTRVSNYKSFANKTNNMFQEKIITFKKLGIIKELNLVEITGGLLAVQKNNYYFIISF